ncbi:MAG: hypothetical protein K0S93_1041 [Nitrososphaeraceae archaeon]|jgi:hypothetical protein|nr:hypothetical protein [Nitrososphaeraceae archaeon]
MKDRIKISIDIFCLWRDSNYFWRIIIKDIDENMDNKNNRKARKRI